MRPLLFPLHAHTKRMTTLIGLESASIQLMDRVFLNAYTSQGILLETRTLEDFFEAVGKLIGVEAQMRNSQEFIAVIEERARTMLKIEFDELFLSAVETGKKARAVQLEAQFAQLVRIRNEETVLTRLAGMITLIEQKNTHNRDLTRRRWIFQNQMAAELLDAQKEQNPIRIEKLQMLMQQERDRYVEFLNQDPHNRWSRPAVDAFEVALRRYYDDWIQELGIMSSGWSLMEDVLKSVPEYPIMLEYQEREYDSESDDGMSDEETLSFDLNAASQVELEAFMREAKLEEEEAKKRYEERRRRRDKENIPPAYHVWSRVNSK